MNLTQAGRRDHLMSFVLRDFEIHLCESIKVLDSGDITVKEIDEVGYKPLVLSKGDWKITKRDGKLLVKSDPKKFVFPEPFDAEIVAFYLTRAGEDDILYAEEFSDGPYDILRAGESVKVSVTFKQPDQAE